jgi:hypothetical protein
MRDIFGWRIGSAALCLSIYLFIYKHQDSNTCTWSMFLEMGVWQQTKTMQETEEFPTIVYGEKGESLWSARSDSVPWSLSQASGVAKPMNELD